MRELLHGFNGAHLLFACIGFAMLIKGVFKFVDLDTEVRDLRRRLGRNK